MKSCRRRLRFWFRPKFGGGGETRPFAMSRSASSVSLSPLGLRIVVLEGALENSARSLALAKARLLAAAREYDLLLAEFERSEADLNFARALAASGSPAYPRPRS